MAILVTKRKNQHDRLTWIYKYDPKRRWFSIPIYLYFKRFFDLLVCVLTLPLILPLLLLCAVLIKIESPHDPIFFLQERTGKAGRRFKMFKFRTMVVNAEELKRQLFPINEDGELARPLKLANDPRVTKVGQFLRKTSLDELPQVINIIRGDMTWVGPRPTSFGLKSYTLWHTERLDVLPGLTGVWQLYGRGSTDFDSWLRLDITYIKHRCLAVDLEIMVRTLGAVLIGSGAH